MNVLLNLQWLIGGVRNDEVRRKNLFELCKFLIDRLTEVCDLFLMAHVDRQGDCAAALPSTIWALPRVVVEIPGWPLVAGKNLDKVSEIKRSPGRGRGYSNTANRVSAFELTRGIDNDLSLARLEFAARCNDVAGAQELAESCWLQSILG